MRVKKPSGRRRVHEELKKPFEYFSNKVDDLLYDSSALLEKKLFSPEYFNQKTAYNKDYLKPYLEKFDRLYEQKGILTGKEKKELQNYISQAKQELRDDFKDLIKATDEDAYRNAVSDAVYIVTSIAQKENTDFINKRKLATEAVDYLIKKRPDLSDVLRQDLIDEVTKGAEVLLPKRRFVKQDGEPADSSLWYRITDNLHERKPAPVAAKKEPSIISRTVNSFGKKVSSVWNNLTDNISTKIAQSIEKVTDPIRTKIQTRNYIDIADSLFKSSHGSLTRKEIIKRGFKALVDNIDYYSRNKRALDEDAALLLNDIFLKREKGILKETKDILKGKGNHFELLCKIANRFGSISKQETGEVVKNLAIPRPTVESLPIGTWKRESLRRTLERSESFHLKFSEFTQNLREEVVYTKGRLNYIYSGIDSKHPGTVEDFTKRIKSSKERFDKKKQEELDRRYGGYSKATYELLYGKADAEAEAERIHNGHIDYVLLDRLTRDKMSQISDSFLTKLLQGKLKISAKNESDFKKLLFGSEQLPYSITERELLERAIPKLKDYQRDYLYKIAHPKKRPYKANFAKSMQSVFKGILKPFSRAPEYVDKHSVIMLPNGHLRMLRDDEHGYVDIAPDGTVEHAPGITNRLAYAMGKYSVSEHTPYDPFFNPAGFHEGDKEELLWKNSELSELQRANLARQATGTTQAMLKGSAIHEIIDHYYKSGGKIVLSKELDMQPEILQKALVTINTLNLRYPKNQGWEIRTEQLIPGFGNLAKFQTAIDVFAYNKWTGKVEILDLKTGHLDDKYVQLQLSAEAYFAEKYSGTGYLTGDREIKAKDIGLFSINTTYKDLKTGERVYSADIKQHALYNLDSIKRIFSDDMWTTEAPGFIHGLKAKLKPEVIDLDDIKNATLFMRTVLYGKDMPARFGFDFINKNGVYTDKDVIVFDLETTKTNKSKNEIQSLGALRFKLDPTKNKFFLAEVNESFFLTRGIPDELDPSSNIHDLTNPKVKELNRLKGNMKSAAISARGILNFMESIKDSIIIGQNVLEYDFSALYSELKRLAPDRYRERYKRKFAQLLKTLTIIDTLTIYRAINYDTNPIYDYSDKRSYHNIDIFNKVNGWAPPPSEAHGSIVDSFMTSSIGEALIRGRSDIPKRVSTFIRYIISHGVKGVTIVPGAPLQAEGSEPSGIPFSAVPTDVRLLNPYPDATGGIHVITQSGTEFTENKFSDEVSWMDTNERMARTHMGFNYDPSKTDEENEEAFQNWFESRIGEHYDEHTAFEIAQMRDEIRFEIIPKLTDRMLKRQYLAEETIKLFHKHLAEYTDPEDRFRFKSIMLSEFLAIRNNLDEKVANKFEYLFFKGLNRKAVKELLDNPFSIEVLNTNTRSINTPDDYITTNQLAMGFVGGANGGYILMQDALAFQLEQVYNTKEEDKYFLMAEGKNDPSEGAQLVALSGDSLNQLKDILTSSIFSEYGGLLKKSELLAGRIENLEFTSRRSILGTIASKAAIANNPQELKTYEAIAGLLLGGMPDADEQMAAFNAAIQTTKERLRDPKTLRTSLYSTMSKAGFSNGMIARVLTDEKVIESFKADDYEKAIDRASKIGVARDYMRNVFGLDMNEKKLAAVMVGDMSLDNLYNPEFAKKYLGATDAYDDRRLKMIKNLQKQYGLSDSNGDVKKLKELAKVGVPLDQFISKIEGVGEAADKAAERLKSLNNVFSNISRISFYDPERLFHAGYSQVGNIHSSLRGLLPNSMNTSLTKFLTGGIQDYEYKWQKYKYGIELMQSVMPVVGSMLGGPTGAMAGAFVGKGVAALASQAVGFKYERATNEFGLFLSSHFNKMGAMFTPAIAALNIFTKALKIASVPLLAGLGMGIYQYKRALHNMSTLDNPLYNLTGVNYGTGYAQTMRADYAFGMRRGTTNSIIENIEFAKQGLISLGKYDKNKMVSAAMLGVFNEAFLAPGNGGGNYEALLNKLFQKFNQQGQNKGRFMYLLNEYNPEIAKQLQARTEYDWFFKHGVNGQWYADRQFPTYDLSRSDRAEFRAITGMQASFTESIQNAFMRLGAAAYRWKGFDLMKGFTSTLTETTDLFLANKPDEALARIAKGIQDFMNGVSKTWTEIKDKLNLEGIKENVLSNFRVIGAEIAHVALGFASTILDSIDKIDATVGALFKNLYARFKDLFDFVGQIRLDIDWSKKPTEPGFISVGIGHKKNLGVYDVQYDDIVSRVTTKHPNYEMFDPKSKNSTGSYGAWVPTDEATYNSLPYLYRRVKGAIETTQERIHIGNANGMTSEDKLTLLRMFFGEKNVNTYYNGSLGMNLPVNEENLRAARAFAWLMTESNANSIDELKKWLAELHPVYGMREYTDYEKGIVSDVKEKLKITQKYDSDVLEALTDHIGTVFLPFLQDALKEGRAWIEKTDNAMIKIIVEDKESGEKKSFVLGEGSQAGKTSLGEAVGIEYSWEPYGSR